MRQNEEMEGLDQWQAWPSRLLAAHLWGGSANCIYICSTVFFGEVPAVSLSTFLRAAARVALHGCMARPIRSAPSGDLTFHPLACLVTPPASICTSPRPVDGKSTLCQATLLWYYGMRAFGSRRVKGALLGDKAHFMLVNAFSSLIGLIMKF